MGLGQSVELDDIPRVQNINRQSKPSQIPHLIIQPIIEYALFTLQIAWLRRGPRTCLNESLEFMRCVVRLPLYRGDIPHDDLFEVRLLKGLVAEHVKRATDGGEIIVIEEDLFVQLLKGDYYT